MLDETTSPDRTDIEVIIGTIKQSVGGLAGHEAPPTRSDASFAPSVTSPGTVEVGGIEDDRTSSVGRSCSGSDNVSDWSSVSGRGSANSDSGSSSGNGSDKIGSDKDLVGGMQARGPGARWLWYTVYKLTSCRIREYVRRKPRYESPPSPLSAESMLALVASLRIANTNKHARWC